MDTDRSIADSETLAIARELISRESISPHDAGCQEVIARYLADLGFTIEQMVFTDVTNLWATHEGSEAGPVFAFAGHTDVVPTGPLSSWQTDPFEPTLKDGMLYGRGAADMKGSLAAMLTAVKRFLEENARHKGTIAFLITSDEEADAINGTAKVMETLGSRGVAIEWCIVGEPSSSELLGDVVRIGRRGSLNGTLKVLGQQGHVAYPLDAVNPIHESLQALADLAAVTWDEGNERFPPTSMQISNIHAGMGVNNVIPGELEVVFNLRFSTESTEASLKSRTHAVLDAYKFDYQLDWSLSGNPFMTHDGALIEAVQTTLSERAGMNTELSTSGGTSDGRFIAPTGTQVVELGPCNKTIHKIDECVSIADLNELSQIYSQILEKLVRS